MLSGYDLGDLGDLGDGPTPPLWRDAQMHQAGKQPVGDPAGSSSSCAGSCVNRDT